MNDSISFEAVETGKRVCDVPVLRGVGEDTLLIDNKVVLEALFYCVCIFAS